MPQIGTLPALRFRHIIGTPLRRPLGPTLAQAWVLFHTNDEDKDPDTDVWVTVTNDKRTVVAHKGVSESSRITAIADRIR